MIEVLRQHIIERVGNNTENIDEVLSHFKSLPVKRNHQLLTQGNVCRHVYFISSGCLQVYSTDENGVESTRDIIVENNWCSELVSFGTQQPATENIRAVEPSELCAIHYTGFQEMMTRVPQFDRNYRQILEASYANSVFRINSFVAMSGLVRIKWLMQYRPELMTRLSSKLIASYLGISSETFSRLKAQL